MGVHTAVASRMKCQWPRVLRTERSEDPEEGEIMVGACSDLTMARVAFSSAPRSIFHGIDVPVITMADQFPISPMNAVG